MLIGWFNSPKEPVIIQLVLLEAGGMQKLYLPPFLYRILKNMYISWHRKNGVQEMSGKGKLKKLADSEDLYRHFGEESHQTEGFAEQFDRAVTDGEIARAIGEKRAHKPGVSRRKALVSSYPPPQSEIDLHGMTSESAECRVRTFIWQSARDKLKTLRIITGKGLHSDGPAVLQDVTEAVLKEMQSAGSIFRYRWEKKAKYRSGAVIVYLN